MCAVWVGVYNAVQLGGAWFIMLFNNKHTWRGEDSLRSGFSPSTVWIPGLKLKLPTWQPLPADPSCWALDVISGHMEIMSMRWEDLFKSHVEMLCSTM